MSRNLPGLRTSSPSLPGTPGTKRTRFEIEDEDLDELAVSIPDSSPYFTQPTQIANPTTQPTQIANRTTQPTQVLSRATQPTQVVERRTTLQRSSPPIPDTPGSVIEVPASSPFQVHSQQRRLAGAMNSQSSRAGLGSGPAGSRIASMMAPAGTAFRAPVPLPRRPQPAIKKQFLSTINSDDDLANDYKHDDSSDDDDSGRPMRNEIQPSTFVRKPQSPVPVAKPRYQMEDKDIDPNEIPNLRLRYLTKQVHKCVIKSKPSIMYRQCRDELQNNGMSMESATQTLLGETRTVPAASTDSRSDSQNALSRRTIGNHQPKIYNQTKLPIPPKPRAASSSPPPSPELAKNVAPRRRLIMGRKNRSPSPDKVFSVSSSHASSSAATSPNRSSPEKMAVAAVIPADFQSQNTTSRRRLLLQGSKKLQPVMRSEVITIDSESDGDLPSLNMIANRKRKAAAESYEVKKRGRLVTRGEKLVIKARKELKNELEVVNLPDDEERFVNQDDESDESGRDIQVHHVRKEHSSVLQYLNNCTPEALARMTGSSVKDSQLVISKRPFESITEVEKIKTKGTKARSKQGDIGSNMIDKLNTWFNAFEAVTTVIKNCADRGRELDSIMAKWEMDRTGRMKDADGKFRQLPIPERPAPMADDIELKTYQLFGLNWMNLLHKLGYSAILADDMGLGKTCQVISFVSHLVQTKPSAKPHVIVVPPSTLENWANEFMRFAPGVKVHLYQGSDRKQFRPRDIASEYDVVLTSYSMVERNFEDIQWLSKLDPYAAIFDEGHKLKNPNTQVYKNLSVLPSKWRLVLTGTPVQNNLKELLGLLSFVEPGLFEDGTMEQMQTIFETKVPNKEVLNFAALAKERVSNARTIMAPFILQRRKDEVLGLPRRVDVVTQIELTGSQKVLYEEIKNNFLAGKSRSKATKDRGNLWQQLRKAAIHPQLFRRHFTDEIVTEMTDILWKKCSEIELNVQSKADRHKIMYRDSLLNDYDFSLHLLCKEFPKYIGRFDVPDRSWEEAPKVEALLKLVRQYQANGDRCLVFSRYEMVIDILRDTMHFAGIKYCELTGRSNVSERFPEIERFNNNPDIPVFLLTTGAGGTGLNLTAANKIILFDQSDNPQDDVQASNRAHRIGQTREVEVIRLVTKKTVETLIYNSCVKKLTLAASVERAVEDEENLEEECRKKMLLGEEEEVVIPPSQMVSLSQAAE
ncbi:SNF2 family N-terminal domain-containing protein [Truncatella angustata]|uniref:SNF2 family N-terminal domain-containing protein n=1 Tax=Truncatella angustata TaxID=152316 RepID=A0A9P8RND4_9PEZI|nr:SNF2 family N-terminal domain-containing protein [Truncatella angustata]KAH6646346.1 SNF2 family N-terminal domain-containing protein [Truncatella angustata]KAH8198620.1 hypothetical protein TruAng_007210 [Truncatella angustata]